MSENPVKFLALGATASMTRLVEAEAVETFARISGDTNPVHLDDEYAGKSQFGKRIAHGLLISSYISAILGTILPGPGSIYLSQAVSFKRPVYLGDEITTTVTVTNIRPDKPIVTLKTVCANQNGTVVIDGEAVLLCPQIEKLE